MNGLGDGAASPHNEMVFSSELCLFLQGVGWMKVKATANSLLSGWPSFICAYGRFFIF